MKKKYNILSDCRGLYEQEVIDTIFEQRGIEDPEHFFNPTVDDMLPLDALKNIDRAYELVKKHLNGDIRVLWDVDVDGVTSGAIMTKYLRDMGAAPKPYINDGKAHGLLRQDIERFSGADLLIIVDSLDADCSQYKKISAAGTDIIVLDHHYVSSEQPYEQYITLVSSQVDYDNPALSGAGVVWKFCKYIDDIEVTDFADKYLDLAASGLVADMMDMTSMENRYIVNEGLKQINCLAIKKIIGSFEFNSTAIAFSISPLVNAAMRTNNSQLALDAFMAEENKEVLACVKALKNCRELQNEEVESLMPDVVRQCEEQIDEKIMTVFIDTPYGISGLFGNKLLEKYQRPLLILKDCGDTWAGSMRAVGVDDFRKMIEESKLAEAKGHELASGVEIPKKNFKKFINYMKKTLDKIEPKVEVTVDIRLNIEDVTRSLIDKIKLIDKVSGTGFKPIRAYIDGICDYEIGQMSDYKHLVIKPQPYIYVIKWNFDGDFEEYEEHAMMNDEVSCVVSLDSGFLGRTFVLKLVCDELETE